MESMLNKRPPSASTSGTNGDSIRSKSVRLAVKLRELFLSKHKFFRAGKTTNRGSSKDSTHQRLTSWLSRRWNNNWTMWCDLQDQKHFSKTITSALMAYTILLRSLWDRVPETSTCLRISKERFLSKKSVRSRINYWHNWSSYIQRVSLCNS